MLQNAAPATCTTDGYTGDTSCLCCDTVCVPGEIIPATNHDWGTWTTVASATCEADGLEKRVCANDASHVEENILLATGHTAGAAVMEGKIAATCTTDGSYNMVVYCATCGNKLSTTAYTIPATDHAWGHNYVDDICTDCGDFRGITCDHLCHQDGFKGFIWKIVQFFWKLFKMNPVCECGRAHY